MEAQDFGLYLRGLRNSKKMSIRQLALYSGVSNAYLSHVENGKRGVPSPDILKKLSKPLGVEYDELMFAAGYIETEGQTTVKHNNSADAFVLDVGDFELTDEEITKKYAVNVDGKPLTLDQLKALADIVRAWRKF